LWDVPAIALGQHRSMIARAGVKSKTDNRRGANFTIFRSRCPICLGYVL
jgi:hypothetical protein